MKTPGWPRVKSLSTISSRSDVLPLSSLPTEAEWESAAGATPHDAEFNFNSVIAAQLLKKDKDRLVEFVHPKSELNGKNPEGCYNTVGFRVMQIAK